MHGPVKVLRINFTYNKNMCTVLAKDNPALKTTRKSSKKFMKYLQCSIKKTIFCN